jgi:hypothetical protein
MTTLELVRLIPIMPATLLFTCTFCGFNICCPNIVVLVIVMLANYKMAAMAPLTMAELTTLTFIMTLVVQFFNNSTSEIP